MSRALRLGLLIGGALIVYRLLLPPQMHDSRRLANKIDYLEEVARTSRQQTAFPNFVIILFDDLGLGDLQSYGSHAIRTPNMDALAAAGIRFINGYAAAPYCSASRAGLLTGREPVRMGFDHVLQPAGSWKDILLRIGGRNRQLPAEEILLSEVLRKAGYATAMIGKWHLGDRSPSLPLDRGFDRFFGLLYSNDQGKPHVWRDREIAEAAPIDQSTLTERYTREAIDFISRRNQDEPFLLYLAHTFPHVPLHASDEFIGSSSGGLYGDVVEELDQSVGAIVGALRRANALDDTLVILTSDNGPWFQGSPGGTRGRKMEIFEGGMRVPMIVHWPSMIGAGRVEEAVVSSLDLFPTILDLCGIAPPGDRVLDGVSLQALFEGVSTSPRDPLFYSHIGRIDAVRVGNLKYHDRRMLLYGNPMDWRWAPFVPKGPWLFDLSRDPDESYDVSSLYPEARQRLAALLTERREQQLANPRGWQ